METKSTLNYDMFKLRDDNRAKMSPAHIDKLAASIKAKNLLEFRPILINAKMEVMDGQHRLMAAKKLRVAIFYQLSKEIKSEDIATLNYSKNWASLDYLNFYCKNDYDEYRKLQKFMEEKQINLNVALMLFHGKSNEKSKNFREGKYIFKADENLESYDIVLDTIEFIKAKNGVLNSVYTKSAKFWQAILYMINDPDFDREKWFAKLKLLVNRLSAKVTMRENLEMLLDIYNWKNSNPIKINFREKDE